MRIIILIILVVCAVPAVAEVYRWVDENGETHYSDHPHENAETVTLPKAQTFSTPAPTLQPEQRGEEAAQDAQADKADITIYESVDITSPMQNEVLWSTGGVLKVSVSVKPRLRREHILMIYLDDLMVESMTGNKRDTELTQVFRGEHTLHAIVQDDVGKVVGRGNSVTFTVKQTSIQNPNSPNVSSISTLSQPGLGG
ncbi:MAG: DUF4124 domain-containing protein [Gammaproteobacteria bacterium]|jgi:hypothetical protein|nr:hypothetical protein [Chromatiales bacterium]MDP6673745.1 DUF4124 domain-containing protein [Gammaproteobacteria bacterium]